MTPTLDSGFVHLIDTIGDIDRVAETARTSTAATNDATKNRRLAERLHRDRHTSPWEFVVFQFEIKAPVFVARQIMRHRMASINEVSGRYTKIPHETYVPTEWRRQHATNRQMSGGAIDEDNAKVAKNITEAAYRIAWATYNELISIGVSREQARIVLPLGTYTKWRWQIDAHNLYNFLKLRLAEDAQAETRETAKAIVLELAANGFCDIIDVWGINI